MPITLDRKSTIIQYFGVFHISLGSILCKEFKLKMDWTVEDVFSLDQSIKELKILKTSVSRFINLSVTIFDII